MKKVFGKLFAALDTHSKDGYSARKLSAFVIIICVLTAHFSWLKNCFLTDNYNLLGEVLMIDYSFISLCLGLTTFETITKLKKQKDEKPNITTP